MDNLRYKFRAWNRETKRMQYFTLNTLLSGYGDDCPYTPDNEEPWIEPTWQPVMQYIGDTNKNNIEIYDQDIVQIGTWIAIIEWDEESCGYYPRPINNKLMTLHMYDIDKVLGSAFENPELLEE